MKTNFKPNFSGSHQLQPVLNKIEEALKKSDAHPCYTPGCRCDALESVTGRRIDDPKVKICDGCKVHWLLETAACIARDAIERSKLS